MKRQYAFELFDTEEEAALRGVAIEVYLQEQTEWISVRDSECAISWDDVGTEVLIWPRNTPDVGATAFYGRGPTGTPEFYKHGAILEGITHYARLPGGPTVLPVTASNTHE